MKSQDRSTGMSRDRRETSLVKSEPFDGKRAFSYNPFLWDVSDAFALLRFTSVANPEPSR
ncbi:predicted protein [Arabidopsis lyrata subsp. lyrata]|uniref:Predicted protein n=1 Tax=Arabidopsis lyrata subsp. lyrata TaxID=81972 RepID=D7KJX4_ARALL|nr:predicted protein [Arabidopsis lyrata subsp. lyrata]